MNEFVIIIVNFAYECISQIYSIKDGDSRGGGEYFSNQDSQLQLEVPLPFQVL